MSNHPDPVDKAADVAQLMLDSALANHKPLYSGSSAFFCEECDATIPEARRLALPGVNLCVGCVEVKERKGK